MKAERTEKEIGGRKCVVYACPQADHILIQPVDDHDMEVMDGEVNEISLLCPDVKFMLVTVPVKRWNSELSPWEAPAVFGQEDFGSGAGETLDFILKQAIPAAKELTAPDTEIHFYIGGYSLAGLFALWAAWQTDVFNGAAGVSPSVWFPGFMEYTRNSQLKAEKIYLSLGDKEEKTRNRVMARVGDCIRELNGHLSENPDCTCILEWNQGNHFREPDKRTAKGFAWLLKH